MKRPKGFLGGIKAMPMPTSKAVRVGQAASAFAHHPPAVEKPVPRMERPRGGHGPKN